MLLSFVFPRSSSNLGRIICSERGVGACSFDEMTSLTGFTRRSLGKSLTVFRLRRRLLRRLAQPKQTDRDCTHLCSLFYTRVCIRDTLWKAIALSMYQCMSAVLLSPATPTVDVRGSPH